MSMDGMTRGSVIRLVIVRRPAPDIRADSSSVGSFLSRALGPGGKRRGQVHALDRYDAAQAHDVDGSLFHGPGSP
jgi:hypothetical protein